MNTTASTRIGCVLVAILISAGRAAAAPPQNNGDAPPAAAGGVQAASSRTEDKGQQAADLLRRARQAMAENDLTAAESLIAQAEALGVEYNSFHLGDTPKKARRDLERKRSAAGPTKPSQLFSPLSGAKKNVPASDPFAGRTSGAAASLPDTKQVMPLPRVDSGAPAELPAVLKAASRQAPAYQDYPSTEPNENDLALPPFLAKGSAQRPAQAAAKSKWATAPRCLAPTGVGCRRYSPRRRVRAASQKSKSPIRPHGRHAGKGGGRHPKNAGSRFSGEKQRSLPPHLRPELDGTGRGVVAVRRIG